MIKFYFLIIFISILLGCGKIALYKQEITTIVVTPAKNDIYYSN